MHQLRLQRLEMRLQRVERQSDQPDKQYKPDRQTFGHPEVQPAHASGLALRCEVCSGLLHHISLPKSPGHTFLALLAQSCPACSIGARPLRRCICIQMLSLFLEDFGLFPLARVYDGALWQSVSCAISSCCCSILDCNSTARFLLGSSDGRVRLVSLQIKFEDVPRCSKLQQLLHPLAFQHSVSFTDYLLSSDTRGPSFYSALSGREISDLDVIRFQ